MIINETTNPVSGEVISRRKLWAWGFLFHKAAMFMACGDVAESSVFDVRSNTREFARACTCCGDLCNGKALDDFCNADPVYSKYCYAGSVDGLIDPELVTAVPQHKVKCTAKQNCMVTYLAISVYV